MTDPVRDAFEAWAKSEGLIQESHGIRSVNSMCNVALKAFEVAYAAGVASAGKDAERFRAAIALEDSADSLHAAVINFAGEPDKIRIDFDAAIELEKGK